MSGDVEATVQLTQLYAHQQPLHSGADEVAAFLAATELFRAKYLDASSGAEASGVEHVPDRPAAERSRPLSELSEEGALWLAGEARRSLIDHGCALLTESQREALSVF